MGYDTWAVKHVGLGLLNAWAVKFESHSLCLVVVLLLYLKSASIIKSHPNVSCCCTIVVPKECKYNFSLYIYQS
jgi:hypothetical protein